MLCLTLLPISGLAQRPTGAIAGVVADTSGAVIPSARLTIADPAHGFTLQLATSSTGAYAASALLPGNYEVRVQAPGFRTAVVQVTVEVGRTTSLDVRLPIGAREETVQVTSNAVQVNPSQTGLEGVITQASIRDLPLNGRNFLDLGQLEPGVQLNPANILSSYKGPYSKLSLGGQSGLTTRVTVDGLDISDEHAGTVAQNISQDSIQEFQISRSTFDPSTGLTGSGAVNIATRSGTNDLHGSGFVFWRDSRVAARIGPTAAPFDREQFGFHVGGPVVRNRLFWFASYERNNQDSVVATNVPVFQQFNGIWPSPFDERMANARLDWNARPNLRVFARFTHNWNDGVMPGTVGGTKLSPVDNFNQANQTAVGLDAVQGRFTHSFRFGYLNYDNVSDNGQNRVPGLPRTLDPSSRPLTINFGAGAGGAQVGPDLNTPGRRYHDTHEFRYDGGSGFGRHALRWGVDVNIIRMNWFESVWSNPEIDLLVDDTSRTTCGSNVLCYPVSGARVGNGLGFWTELPCHGLPHGCIPNDRFHWYVADGWRITPRLNLNYGLRWVYEPGPDNPDLNKPALQDALLPAAGKNRRDQNNFAPQLGVAWSPTSSGKWVLRAAAGVFYDTNLLKHVIFERNNALPLGITSENVVLTNNVLRNPVSGTVIFDMSPWINRPLGTSGLIDAVLAASAAFGAAYQVAFANFPSGLSRCEALRGGCATFGSNYRTPYSFQFNAGIQHELRPGLVLSADFVRNRGLHQLQRRDRNRVGAADTFNIVNAQAAMNAEQFRWHCPAGPAGVDCAITAGATIDSYANRGLGIRQNATPTALNNSAFPGLDPSLNRMQLWNMGGITTYNALQVNLRGRLPNLGQAARDWTVVGSYSLGRLEAAGTFEDPALINFSDSFSNDGPMAYRGPAALDRTHMLSVGSLFTVLGGIRLNSVWRAFSALPQSVFVQTGSAAASEIFKTDFNGDGFAGDPLPGTSRGSYGRDIGCGAAAINRVIDAYNATQAGNLTPAGQALVNAGLFARAQLVRLGAKSPSVTQAPTEQVCLDSFITTDLRIARPFKLKGERITVEPALEWFNLFNIANFDGADNKLNGVLSGEVGSLNGTTAANRPNRAGFTGGSFALGTPRSWQLAIRVSF